MKQKNSNRPVAGFGAVSSGVLLIPLLFSAGCFSAKSPTVEPPASVDVAASEALVPENVTVPAEVAIASGQNFSAVGIAFLEPAQPLLKPAQQQDDFIEAEGYGFPAKGAEGAVHKRLTALEAARYRALANLAVEILGQSVTRDARVVDMAFAGEEIQVNFDGKLTGVSEVSHDYDEETGIATVTLKVARDPQKNGRASVQPRSLEQRKARAEAAARIQATALLREQVGQVLVEQDIRVENLVLKHQEARAYVQGILEGTQFSDARWVTGEKCEVTAMIGVDRERVSQLLGELSESFFEENEADSAEE